MQLFEVGGCVRDEILGVPSKDIDFTVVLDEEDVRKAPSILTPFDIMRSMLMFRGFEIFVETPQFLTIRARFPRYSNGSGFVMPQRYSGKTADFVLARKEADYSDGRRPDVVEPGTLMDDLARRDFTMNAIAKDENGNLIDPFNGRAAIAEKLILCVGDADERLIKEDALRGLRAIRFSVTKGFTIDETVRRVIMLGAFRRALRSVSTERIQQELDKAFKVDSALTIRALTELHLLDTVFDRDRLHLVTSVRK